MAKFIETLIFEVNCVFPRFSSADEAKIRGVVRRIVQGTPPELRCSEVQLRSELLCSQHLFTAFAGVSVYIAHRDYVSQLAPWILEEFRAAS